MCLAIPGEIIAIEEDDLILRKGKVSFGGAIREVALSTVPEAIIGDFVLVHAGIAIGIVDKDEADRVLESIAQIEMQDDEDWTEP